ncbi:MAG TPA: COQ9 family protein [Rhizomicrobium sp.]|jgi:ubiquinone biosynthesis protein COQ9|nr:COQ9 family protein [Rhizomicrobium sp.]
MSDTPPKGSPARKKAASKSAKPGNAEQTPKTDDANGPEAKKAAVLAAALPQAAFDGFNAKVLEAAGKEAGVGKTELAVLFPDGPLGLIAFYSRKVDTEMVERLAQMDLPAMKIRARIQAAVLARLAILKPHKEAARRAAALLSLPMHAGLATRLMYHTVDAMWRAAGDTATDFNFYTKRGILAGVYGSTLVRWLNDTSADEVPTREFLAARIENVMQFEKFKAQARQALSNFPGLAAWMAKKPAEK